MGHTRLLLFAFVVVSLGCVDSSTPSDGGVDDGGVDDGGVDDGLGDGMENVGAIIDLSGDVDCFNMTCGPGELCRVLAGGFDAFALSDGGVAPSLSGDCVAVPDDCVARECDDRDYREPDCAPCLTLCSGWGVHWLEGRRLQCYGG